VYYNCVKFHKTPISRFGGVALTRYTTPKLETPVYSIYHWNCHRKHKSPDEFKDQDSTLADQVIRLNTKVKELNDRINITPATRTQYNINLYADGVHPENLMAKTWLKEIVDQAQLNC
jgi:hypothetical protein